MTNKEYWYHCAECGRDFNVIWWVIEDLWCRYSPTKDLGGVLCIDCFEKKCRDDGILIRMEAVVITTHLNND